MFEADPVETRVLVDNFVDILLPAIADHCVTRWGLVEQFDTFPEADAGHDICRIPSEGVRRG